MFSGINSDSLSPEERVKIRVLEYVFSDKRNSTDLYNIEFNFWGRISSTVGDSDYFNISRNLNQGIFSLKEIKLSRQYSQDFVSLPGVCTCITSFFGMSDLCTRLRARYNFEFNIPNHGTSKLIVETTALEVSKWRANGLMKSNPELFQMPVQSWSMRP